MTKICIGHWQLDWWVHGFSDFVDNRFSKLCAYFFFFFGGGGRGERLNFAMIWCVIYIFVSTFRVRLNIAYFAKNWKLEPIKKIVKKLLYTCGILFICFNALFMSNEQCTKHWSVKKEKKGLKRKMSKRECNPNAHLEGKKKGRS